MKRISKISFFAIGLIAASAQLTAERLVILHTNDTHSIIDPYFANDRGGVARRKVLIDSVRASNPNVLLVDAGDVLQGSLYYTLHLGEAEQKMMNYLGYDLQILGNHEFDNGMKSLSEYLKGLNAQLIATNYDMSRTDLDSLFSLSVVKQVDDKKIGFIGLNIQPAGLIDSAKCEGVVYSDPLKAANAMAWYLRHAEGVDYVVALTHIGYQADVDLAKHSEGINLIIGGHSHTAVDAEAANALPHKFLNLVGDTVTVAQTGRYGASLGEVVLDLDNGHISTRLIPVDKRLDSGSDKELIKIISQYKQKVDSVAGLKISTASADFPVKPELVNWMADFVKDDAQRLTTQKIDLSIVNPGGVRSPFGKGAITKGHVMQSFPFDNYEVVMELSGEDLQAALDSLSTKGMGVSRNVTGKIDPVAHRCYDATIDGQPIDPDRIYYVATINYLAQGNDGLTSLRNGKVVARSENFLYDDMINSMEHGKMHKKIQRPDGSLRLKPLSK